MKLALDMQDEADRYQISLYGSGGIEGGNRDKAVISGKPPDS